MSAETTGKDPHFGKIFWYVVYITTIVFGYVFCVTFLHVPKENQRFVDIAFGFMLGSVLGSGIGYLLGGSPDRKRDLSVNAEQISTTTLNQQMPGENS